MAQAAKTKKIFDNRYEILSIVGRGARSVVYHAKTITAPINEVALKVLLDQQGKTPTGERLRREALALVSARHRYVIRLDDFHSVNNLCYLSMEYAPEADLRKYTTKLNAPLPITTAELFLSQICEALSFVHKARIIHRDIKPDNILVLSAEQCRLADFGIAILPSDTSNQDDTKSGPGTMSYLAPEVLDGSPHDFKSDMYALGLSFYEMISGNHPFDTVPLSQQREVRKDSNLVPLHEIRKDCPEYLSTVIAQAMSEDPRNRFENTRDMLQALSINKSAPKEIPPSIPAKKPVPEVATAKIPAKSNPVAQPEVKTSPLKKDSQEQSNPPRPRKMTGSFNIKKNKVSKDIEPGTTQLVPAYGATAYGITETVQVSPQDMKKAIQAAATPKNQPQNNPPEVAPVVSVVPDTIFNQEPKETVADTIIAPIEMRTEPDPTQSEIKKDEPTIAQHIEPIQALGQAHGVTQTTFIDRKAVDSLRSMPKAPIPGIVGDEAPLKRSSLRHLAILGALCGIGLIIVPGIINMVSSWMPDASDKTSQPQEQVHALIPAVASADFTFPALPSGMYSGSISELVPGKTSGFTLISFESRDELIVLAGIEGWTPVVLHPRAKISAATITPNTPAPALRVASNGFILELTGQNVDGELFGYFKNVITGRTGEWRARPMGKKAAKGAQENTKANSAS